MDDKPALESFIIKKDIPEEILGLVEELRGPPGKDGKDGMDGVDGKDGFDGKPGPKGDPGPQGPQGERGLRGLDGNDGKDGKDGAPGKDGKNGKDGLPGKDGLNGKDGKDGKDGSPDTGEQIVDKINTTKGKKISKDRVDGFDEIDQMVRNNARQVGQIQQRGGQTSLRIKAAGGNPQQVETINFSTGSTVTSVGDGREVNITFAGGGGSPGGSTTQMQYNNAGSFGGISGATSDGTTATFTSPRFVTEASPSSNDGAALGTTSLNWSDVFLATGAVINYNNGNVTLTHASGQLTLAGLLNINRAGVAAVVTDTTNTASATPLRISNSRTGTTNDTVALQFNASNSSAGVVNIAQIKGRITNVTPASETGAIRFAVLTGGSVADEAEINATSFNPTTNDGLALGTTALSFADLFLATGGVINFNNGDVTLTHSSNNLALAGGTFNFGANTAYFTETDNGNSGTADTIDWTTSNKQKSTLTGNCTFTFTAPPGPCSLILRLVQDATGSRTVTWPATVKWPSGTAPTLTTTANKIDIISFYYDGTNYYGNSSLNFTA